MYIALMTSERHMTEKTNDKTMEADTTEKAMEDDYALRTIILQWMFMPLVWWHHYVPLYFMRYCRIIMHYGSSKRAFKRGSLSYRCPY